MPDGFSLGMHAQDVGEYKRLDEGVLRSLVKRIANGDAVARTELLRANFRLVIKYAVGRYSYLSPAQRQRLDLLDLVQEGYCRLWEKLDKFDPNKASFSTWATYWLQAAIGRMIDEDSRAVHIPSHVAAQAKQISKARTALLSAGKSTSQKDLQQATGVDDERYEAITRFVLGVNPSLDASINGEDTTLLDMVGITAEPAEQDQWLEASHIQQSVLEALWDLGEDDKRMLDILLLSAGFYFADEGCEEYGEPLSLRQIGKIYNLTGEAIRQIRKRAIEKLKRHPALAEFRRHQQ